MAQSVPSGITKLTKLLQHLNKPPKLTFASNVKSLRLTLAYSNDHWGAKHFVKEDLPRIRHFNPDLEIDVIKWQKEKNELWRPELEVQFDDGKVRVVDMDDKNSSKILKEVMAIVGGDPWKKYVDEAEKIGTPIESPDDNQAKKKSLSEFRLANAEKEKKFELARKKRIERMEMKKRGDMAKREMKTEETSSDMSVSEVQPSNLETTPSTSSQVSTAAATS